MSTEPKISIFISVVRVVDDTTTQSMKQISYLEWKHARDPGMIARTRIDAALAESAPNGG